MRPNSTKVLLFISYREAQVLGVEPSKKEKVKKRQREDDEDEVPVMKKKMKKRVIDEDVDKRTVFIGNLPNTTTKKVRNPQIIRNMYLASWVSFWTPKPLNSIPQDTPQKL